MQTQVKAQASTSFTPAYGGLLQRTCACGDTPGLDGQCAQCRRKRLSGQMSPLIQTKLRISRPGDKYEREADRVAQQVMLKPEPRVQRQVEPELQKQDKTIQAKPIAGQTMPVIQRRAEPELEEEEPIQAKHRPGRAPNWTSDLSARIHSLGGGGRALPESVKAYFEPRFGYDFSKVRVHNDSRAAETARALNARAFTLGREIIFDSGQYLPGTNSGKRLLGHELTHTVQQAGEIQDAHRTATDTINSNSRSGFQTAEPSDLRTMMTSARTKTAIQISRQVRDAGPEDPPKTDDQYECLKRLGACGVPGGLPDLSKINEKCRDETKYKGEDITLTEAECMSPQDMISEVLKIIEQLQKDLDRPGLDAAKRKKIQSKIDEFNKGAWNLCTSYLSKKDCKEFSPHPSLNLLVKQAGHGAVLSRGAIAFAALIVWIFFFQDPVRREQTRKALNDLHSRIQSWKKGPEPLTSPTPIPIKPEPPTKEKKRRRRRRRRKEYPICWPEQFGPPTQTRFVRKKVGGVRDYKEQKQARMQLRWRNIRDPDFDDRIYHVHHVIPLFLGGADNLGTNALTLYGTIHLKGHRVLRKQPQMLKPPRPLKPLDPDIYKHPGGTRYFLAGYKKEPNELCP